MVEEGGHVLMASRRSWLVSALKGILEDMGLDVVNVETPGDALDHVHEADPALVLVDHDLDPDEGIPRFCRHLIQGGLSRATPLVVYSSGTLSRADLHAEALDAGAWAVVRDPLEAGPLSALVRRLLRMSDLISLSRVQEELVDPETGLLTLSGLRRVLPALGALAARNRAPMVALVVGPTRDADRDLRLKVAEICAEEVRSSDLCAWVNETELAIVAYDTPAEGARTLASRLSAAAREAAPENGEDRLSAGIVEIGPLEELQEAVSATRREPLEERDLPPTDFRDLFSLSAAREALEQARRAGGGIRVVGAA